MPIQILSARLANQIAAGEVVERPASVVKELVENSIDAGATLIEIDIEKGGSKLIRIRDNGSGIEKQELTLALSRHATSKIANLDDLEAIVSLGFRGEALASISSVSRLTLTSRTQAQTEAWCAYAEGRDMSVQIKPAAHPVGTTVDVVDLFFNTPARRKFLRTDKTEFNHIDELVKRIALSRFDITLVLRHNGNLVRQFRAATTDAQREKRLSSICGTAFVKSAVKIELHHHDVSLTGWICSPAGARKQNDVQYCFVNQRMMKDKLINHAIRQGYESLLRSEQYAAFVLFIHVDPHQVDVNVHPAKHEVRFHQSRFIHDFIYQAVADALYQLGESSKLTAQCYDLAHANVNNQSSVSFVTSHAEPRSDSLNHRRDSSLPAVKESTIGYHQAKIPEKRSHSHYSQRTLSSKSYQGLYQSLMTTTDEIPDNTSSSEMSIPETSASHLQEWETQPSMLGNPLAIVEQKYLLLQQGNALFLLELRQAEFLQRLGQLHLVVADDKVKTLPLLIPQTFSVSQEEWRCVEEQQHLLQDFGIVIKKKSEQKIILMAICSVLRHKNMQEFISAMIDYFKIKKESAISKDEFARWLADFATPREITYSLVKATTLVSSLEYQWKEKLTTYQDTLLRPLDVAVAIEAFKA